MKNSDLHGLLFSHGQTKEADECLHPEQEWFSWVPGSLTVPQWVLNDCDTFLPIPSIHFGARRWSTVALPPG